MIIGLDVGGTHTDVVLLKEGVPLREVKFPTDKSDLFNTVLSALEKILKGVASKGIKRIVLSTTLTTNAIVQRRKNPDVGVIITAGPGMNPESFRQGENYHIVPGAVDHRGREVEPVAKKSVEEASRRLQERGVTCVGVVGKFSPRNPDHERFIAKTIGPSFEKIFMGHEISGNLNFPRRIATTLLNASVYKTHKLFFEAVQKSLKAKGLTVPIQILKADGGTMNLGASMHFPGESVLSGPAASTMGAIGFAPANEDVIVLDIGGTTTDISILIDRAPVLEPIGIRRGEYKSLIRSLKTKSIGIGGDSRVQVENNRISIGPRRKGPAMGFGGKHPTPTDALIAMGLMDHGSRKDAMAGIAAIGKQLKISTANAAEKIFSKACKTIVHESFSMVDKINSAPVYTVHEFLDGYKITPSKILIIGGPAPYFAKKIEEISRIRTEVLPRWGTANATGAALARTTCEVNLMADTELKTVSAPGENFSENISESYSDDDAVEKAYSLLRDKALKNGASAENFEAEVTEFQEFNIVRNSKKKGKNIRVKIQVKPGLIDGYQSYLHGALL